MPATIPLIQIRTAVTRIRETVGDALKVVESLRHDAEYPPEDILRLKENLEQLARDAENALPAGLGPALDRELRRLEEPRFGWCRECGAEWGFKPATPRAPGGRCGDCGAPESARVSELPENPPKRGFRDNPLMDFLEKG